MRVRTLFAVLMLMVGFTAQAATDAELKKFAAAAAKKHKLDEA